MSSPDGPSSAPYTTRKRAASTAPTPGASACATRKAQRVLPIGDGNSEDSSSPRHHPRPRGPAPKGKQWSTLTGEWVPNEAEPEPEPPPPASDDDGSTSGSDDEEEDDNAEPSPHLPPPPSATAALPTEWLPKESEIAHLPPPRLKEILTAHSIAHKSGAPKKLLVQLVGALVARRRALTTDRVLEGDHEWGRRNDGTAYLIEAPLEPFRSWCNLCGRARGNGEAATWYKCTERVGFEACGRCQAILAQPHALTRMEQAGTGSGAPPSGAGSSTDDHEEVDVDAPAPAAPIEWSARRDVELLEAYWSERYHARKIAHSLGVLNGTTNDAKAAETRAVLERLRDLAPPRPPSSSADVTTAALPLPRLCSTRAAIAAEPLCELPSEGHSTTSSAGGGSSSSSDSKGARAVHAKHDPMRDVQRCVEAFAATAECPADLLDPEAFAAVGAAMDGVRSASERVPPSVLEHQPTIEYEENVVDEIEELLSVEEPEVDGGGGGIGRVAPPKGWDWRVGIPREVDLEEAEVAAAVVD